MEWTAEQIRSLRCRMGWSQADLARRLACESALIVRWEQGQEVPPMTTKPILEMLFQQAELAAHEILQSCQAEMALHERALESIDLSSLESDEPKKL